MIQSMSCTIQYLLDKARNLKLILSTFELLSDLKINFHKSELFCLGEAQDHVTEYAEFSAAAKANFQLGTWEFRFTIGDLPMLSGNWLRKDFRLD
jgi:hypothetical protein